MSFNGSATFPTRQELDDVFRQKYGPPDEVGWAPRRRFRAGYFLPADVYETLVAQLVRTDSTWLDVGGGHDIFPENPTLARTLAARSRRVVAVDPSENVLRNQFVSERVQQPLERYSSEEHFDLVTMRMVVEHVDAPEAFCRTLNAVVAPNGRVALFTVNRRSPIALISRLMPFRWHHPIKRLFWGGEEEDTFPVRYRMNTRSALKQLFERHGFEEELFVYLDDLSTFGWFKRLNAIELGLWKALNYCGLRYPETCLLGVYRRTGP